MWSKVCVSILIVVCFGLIVNLISARQEAQFYKQQLEKEVAFSEELLKASNPPECFPVKTRSRYLMKKYEEKVKKN